MNATTKKILKISGITLGAILSIIIIIVALVCWTILTPSKLTKLAQKTIDSNAPCKVDLKNADLTLVRTYPFLGLCLNEVLVHDEMETSPNDTLLYIDRFTVTVDLKTYLKTNKIILTNLLLDKVQANLFTDSQGNGNLSFLTDGAVDEPAEEQEMELYLDLQNIIVSDVNIAYNDLFSGTAMHLDDLGIKLKGLLDRDSLDAGVTLDIAQIDAAIKNDSTNLEASVKGLKGTGQLSKYADNVACNFNIQALNTYAAEGTMSAVVNDLNLILGKMTCRLGNEGLEDLKAAFNMGAANLKFMNDGMTTTTGRILMMADEAAMAGDSLHMSGFSFTSNDIDLQMVDSTGYMTRATLESLLLNLEGGLKTDLSSVNTGLSASLTGADISMDDGISPLKARSESFSFSAEGKIYGDEVVLVSDFSTPALWLDMNGDNYLPGWPLKLSIPLKTNRNVDRFNIPNGAALTVNGQRIGFNANGVLGGSSIVKGSAGIRTADLNIDKLVSMIPAAYKDLLDGIDVHGIMGLDLSIKGDIKESGINLETAVADVALRNLDATMNDSLHAESRHVTATVQYPSTIAVDKTRQTADVFVNADDLMLLLVDSTSIDARFKDLNLVASVIGLTDTLTEMSANVDISLSCLDAVMDTISATFHNAALSATLTPDDGLTAMMANIEFDEFSAVMGSMLKASMGNTTLLAKSRYDATKDDIFLKWDPQLKMSVKNGNLEMLAEPVLFPQLDIDFTLDRFKINDSRMIMGNSDIIVWGDIYNLGEFIEKTGLLTGEMYLESDHVDVTQLLGFLNGFTGDESEGVALNQPIEAGNDTLTAPFMVPKGIDLTMYTNFAEITYNDHLFTNVGGDVTIKDGVAVLQELGFSSDAAKMQLTAIYKSPSIDELFMELDFHLLDIEIDELISLVPAVDSIIPMLKSFSGKAQFHLAVETEVKPDYWPKMSTLIGAAAIEGKNLVIMDNEVFNSIKKKLLMSKNATNVIDSLDVEIQILRNKVDLYPFLIHMDRYQAVIAGRHNINKDLDCGYHISLTDTPLPIRLGVDISGPIVDIADRPLKHIKLVRPKYNKLFKPDKRGDTEQKVLSMKQDILETLRSNVREQYGTTSRRPPHQE